MARVTDEVSCDPACEAGSSCVDGVRADEVSCARRAKRDPAALMARAL